MLNVALLSRWHPHATGYGRDFKAHPEYRVTVVWDELPDRGEQWTNELGCDFEPDYDKVLARADVDGICCTAPTNMHKELIIRAARAGKHIFTEKVLTPKKADALEIKDVLLETGVKFVISFPMRTNPFVEYAKKLMADGTLGTINFLRVRNAHNGISGNWLPEDFKNPVSTGGGAMMDLGAHPMYLCSYLLGKPKRIVSMFNRLYNTPVDDNCVSVIEFGNKAIAVSETGFVSDSSPFSFELTGTNGTLIYGGADGLCWVKTSTVPDIPKGSWIVPRLPKPTIPSAIDQFVGAVLRNEQIYFGIDDAIALSELMDGAYRSYHENRTVEFSEL